MKRHTESKTKNPTERYTHHHAVSAQFSAQANAYLSSAVHANGPDLVQMNHCVDEWLTQQGEEKKSEAIALDMGCGAGHVAFHLAPKVTQLVACDLSQTMLDVVASAAKERGLNNLAFQQSAVEALPSPDQHFDIVATRYSAHHWHDLGAGLAQMHRCAKKGALAIFMDTAAPESPLFDTWLQSMELLRDPSHVRNYSVSQWQQHLTSAGFSVARTHLFRIRLEFASWIKRINTPALHAEAIRSLQSMASKETAQYFAIEDDGSFTIDSLLIEARA